MDHPIKCYACGKPMSYQRKEVACDIKGRTYVFQDVEAWVCECGAEVYPPDEVRRMLHEMHAIDMGSERE